MPKLSENIFAWAQAFFIVCVLWGLNNILDIYSIRVLDINPVLYSCAAFASSAFILMLYAGRGPLAVETMRSIDTWVFGISVLLTYVVGLNLFALVSATEGTLILRFSMVTALLASWFFLSRKPTIWQLIGNGIVGVSVIVLCEGADADIKPLVYILMLLSALLQTIRVFAAEFHKPHKHATTMVTDPKARCRVVGFIMFAVSALFLGVTLAIAFIQSSGDGAVLIPSFPVLADFTHPASILVGLLAGVIFIAPIRLLEFSVISKINTANFLTVASLSFVATWFWEWALQPFTGLGVKDLSHSDIMAGFAITFGGLLIAVMNIIKTKSGGNKDAHLIVTTQDLALVDDSREIVANTLEHFAMDLHKSAKALGVPKSVVEAILVDHNKVLAFKEFNEISRRFRTHVANRDGLTNLLNRSGFMVAFKQALSAHKNGAVFYIDLDKFKPVNDTYGHDAGDEVLWLVVRRMEKHLPARAYITRMGGDEYCAFVPNLNATEMAKTKAMLGRELALPYKLAGNVVVEISASIGTAHYPSQGKTPAELIAAADKGMYGVKHADIEGA